MDADIVGELLRAIRDAVTTTNHKDDDIALPLFDPERHDCGAASWCNNVEALSEELKWSSIRTAAKAGKALKGSALIWYESWEPSEGRSWENLRRDITDAYPEKKNLSERLSKAVLYTSDASGSYSEYAREKLRLLRNTKITFTDVQLIELVCGGISDVDVKMASLNSAVTTTAALISLLSTYAKNRKRSLDSNIKESGSESSETKRIRLNVEKKCFWCNQTGHFQAQCPKNLRIQTDKASQGSKPIDPQLKSCTYCKRMGHTENICFHKQRAESKRTVTSIPTKEVNFLEK